MDRQASPTSPPLGEVETLYAGVDPAALSAAELGALADQYAGLDERVAALNKQVEEVAKERSKVKRLIIAAMEANNVVVIGGTAATVMRVTKHVPIVVDWGALYAHIKETGHFELLHRRLTEKSVRERWDNNELVPGVNGLPVDTLSISVVPQRKSIR